MNRIQGAIALLISVVLLPPAVAMQCRPIPFEKQVQSAESIFRGTIVKVVPVDEEARLSWKGPPGKPRCGAKIATFKVEKVWKGSPKKYAQVFSQDGCVGLGHYYAEGETYIVFAQKKENPRSYFDFEDNWVCAGTESVGDGRDTVLEKRLDGVFASKR